MNVMQAVLEHDARTAPQRAVGRLDLAWRHDGAATRLDRFYQQGCLKARLPRAGARPDLVEVVALNISGGIAGGDDLATALALGAGARVSFSTQAAERVYRASTVSARVATRLSVGTGAMLAYLPQETILFDGAALDRSLDVVLAPGARFLGVEALLFGRLAMGEQVRTARLDDQISLYQGGALIWRDITRLHGDLASALDRPGIAAGARAVATIFGVGFAGCLAALRAALAGAHAGASLMGEVLLARILAPDGARLRQLLNRALAVFPDVTPPRVWQG